MNLKEESREDFLIIHTEDLKQYLIFWKGAAWPMKTFVDMLVK